MIKSPEKIKSKNLEVVWKWKDEVSEELRGKSFEEIKKILKKVLKIIKT